MSQPIGTPITTADGATIHPGAEVWYFDKHSTTGDVRLFKGRVLSMASQAVTLSLSASGIIDKHPNETYSDPHAALDAAIKFGAIVP